jgi:V-type H+-transporting ATPase subunit H
MYMYVHVRSYCSSLPLSSILDLLDRRITFQLQYQLVFCIWMLSFQSSVVEKMKEYPLAAVLCDVLRATNREKVQRVIFATFRNLIEKPSQSVADHFAAEMIHFKAVPVLNVLVQQTRDDTDMQEDITFLHERLNASLQDLSSWDEYAAEVKSGRLEWSPVHRSDKFWRENVMKLNENNHEILKTLVVILQESQSAVAIAVAAHDLGEYVRYYPRGKRNVDALGAKEMVMGMVSHGNSDVRMQALLAIQKMMVQNWEYLGRQLTEDTASTSKTVELH